LKERTGKKGDRLEAIREAHSLEGKFSRTDRMEDYLEVIYELIQEKGYATTIDISRYLNVSSPSVTYEKYRGIVLTEEGTSIAKGVHARHNLLVEFLKMIGVKDDMANLDAEGIEHHLHPETLKKLEDFVRYMKKK